MRAVAQALPSGGRVADVGCGYGRWFPVTSTGRSVFGMDLSDALVRAAAVRTEGIPVVRADLRHPPFRRNTFAGAYTVKVLQFLPQKDRGQAIAGLLSITAPGGRLVLYEKTAGTDGSPATDWIRWGKLAGGRLLSWHGNQFVPLDRLLVALARATRRPNRSNPTIESTSRSHDGFRRQHPGLYVVYGRTRQVLLWLSLLVEPVLERFAPATWADHGIFVFEKT